MLKLINKIAQNRPRWMDEIDDVEWDGDDPRRMIGDDNFQDYLVDDIEEPSEKSEPNLQPEPPPITEPPPALPQTPDFMQEIPSGSELLGIPEDTQEVPYDSADHLISDGINNTEVISFEYTNRFGDYAGLRTVEPHYTFIANSTQNEVLVTFDRDVNDIRAFIVGNIHPGGVRYKGVNFDINPEIMKGVY